MHAHYPVGMSIFQNFQLTLATRRISRTLQFSHKNHSPDFKNIAITLRFSGYDYVLPGYETATVKRTGVKNQNKRKRHALDHSK